MIERAYRNNQTHVIVWGNNNKAYFIDLTDKNSMFQLNEVTRYKRPIQRQAN
jgi:hypothetical protein